MTRRNTTLLLFPLIVLFTFSSASAVELDFALSPKVIYGEDDRQEANQYPNRAYRERAESVAGMVENFRLGRQDDFYRYANISMQDYLGVCSDVRFSQQPVLPLCTATLIGPDLLVTAGHCVRDQRDCESFKYVFGFKKGLDIFPEEEVYECEKLLERKQVETNKKIKDYALIQLDRKVQSRDPLKVRNRGHLSSGIPIVVIGHPSGLPLKISDGAKSDTYSSNVWNSKQTEQKGPGSASNFFNTLKKGRDIFVANLDTFAGNSGSPVFNEWKEIIEGILIAGEEDFITRDGESCRRLNRLEDDRPGEQVFRLTRIKNLEEFIEESFKRHGMHYNSYIQRPDPIRDLP